MQNGNNKDGKDGKDGRLNADVLADTAKEKSFRKQQFPIHSLDDVLGEIRRAGGTGKLEINFKDGRARGEAKWRGFSRITS